MKIETKLQLEHILDKSVKQRIKDGIIERMEVHVKNFQNKNKKRNAKNTRKSDIINQESFNNLKQHVFNNKTNPQSFTYNTKIEELEKFKNSSDYEAMWEIAMDKWTRNGNFYREQLTGSILKKFGMNNKRQKRQTKIDFVELTEQNINGSATGPQDIFIEHYDCDVEEITKVKYYELNKISTCIFEPLLLDMTKTEVQLLSKAQVVEIKSIRSCWNNQRTRRMMFTTH